MQDIQQNSVGVYMVRQELRILVMTSPSSAQAPDFSSSRDLQSALETLQVVLTQLVLQAGYLSDTPGSSLVQVRCGLDDCCRCAL